MSDVFISYKREDRANAEIVAKALKNQGFSVFWDPDITFGHPFDQVLSQELSAAKCVIVLWSSKSISSEWVRDEAHRAANRGVLVPVFLEDVVVPIGLGLLQAAKLNHWKGAESDPEFQRLVKAVSVHVQERKPIPPPRVPRVNASKMTLLSCGGAIALICTVAVTVINRANCSELYSSAIRQYEEASAPAQESAARELFKRASRCGSDLAGMWMARCYHKGIMGCEHDEQKGQELARSVIDGVTRKSANGDAGATFLLASAYEDGLAVQKDSQKSATLLRKAAEADFPLAQFNLATHFLSGELSGSKKDAEKSLRSAAEHGVTQAAFQLGIRYFESDKMDDAAVWFQKAADHGHPVAEVKLGDITVRKDPCAACKWYQRAAALGSPEGQVGLGWCYYKGLSCAGQGGASVFSKDGCEATRLFRAAAERSNVQGLYNLGLALEYGYCNDRTDLEQAKQYLEKASRGGSKEAVEELKKINPQFSRSLTDKSR